MLTAVKRPAESLTSGVIHVAYLMIMKVVTNEGNGILVQFNSVVRNKDFLKQLE